MGEGGGNFLGGLILVILLLIASGVALYEINIYFGAFLSAPLWLGTIAFIGILDCYAFYKITNPSRR